MLRDRQSISGSRCLRTRAQTKNAERRALWRAAATLGLEAGRGKASRRLPTVFFRHRSGSRRPIPLSIVQGLCLKGAGVIFRGFRACGMRSDTAAALAAVAQAARTTASDRRGCGDGEEGSAPVACICRNGTSRSAPFEPAASSALGSSQGPPTRRAGFEEGGACGARRRPAVDGVRQPQSQRRAGRSARSGWRSSRAGRRPAGDRARRRERADRQAAYRNRDCRICGRGGFALTFPPSMERTRSGRVGWKRRLFLDGPRRPPHQSAFG